MTETKKIRIIAMLNCAYLLAQIFLSKLAQSALHMVFISIPAVIFIVLQIRCLKFKKDIMGEQLRSTLLIVTIITIINTAFYCWAFYYRTTH